MKEQELANLQRNGRFQHMSMHLACLALDLAERTLRDGENRQFLNVLLAQARLPCNPVLC